MAPEHWAAHCFGFGPAAGGRAETVNLDCPISCRPWRQWNDRFRPSNVLAHRCRAFSRQTRAPVQTALAGCARRAGLSGLRQQ